MEFRFGRFTRVYQLPQSFRGLDGVRAKCVVENDFFAMLAFDVKDGTARDRDMHHFLEAECLSAELSFVVVPTSFFATFEFDGIGSNGSIGTGVHFDEIGFSDET